MDPIISIINAMYDLRKVRMTLVNYIVVNFPIALLLCR